MTHELKAWADWYVSCAGGNVPNEAQAAYDAIDEIARLTAEVERLRSEIDSATSFILPPNESAWINGPDRQ